MRCYVEHHHVEISGGRGGQSVGSVVFDFDDEPSVTRRRRTVRANRVSSSTNRTRTVSHSWSAFSMIQYSSIAMWP
jgi:hypothetical protein